MRLAHRFEATTWVVAALLVYVVLVGGTTWGELNLPARIVNALLAGTMLTILISRLRESDRTDELVILAVALFAVAAVFSAYPRQSLDAVLAALTYAAAFFVGRRLLASTDARRWLLRGFMALSLVLTLLTASRWTVVIEWWALTGWTVAPPLNMELDATPWGHRHDLALLVVLLYPAWWIGPRSPLRTVAAVVVGVLAGCIVVVDGSRSLLLAILVALLAVAAPAILRAGRRHARAALGWSLALLVVLLVVMVVGGAARTFVERALAIDTLVARSELWSALFGVWLSDPITGLGPGSMPFALQHTDYFASNGFAPRHPDNVLVQALAESGLIGIAGIGAVLAAVVPGVLRGPATARWALVVFAVAGIGSNPTEFAFLVLPAIAWAAYAMPRPWAAPAEVAGLGRGVRRATVAAACLIGVAYASSVIGAAWYEGARTAAARGDREGARDSLAAARAFDPSLALYPRAAGVLQLAEGDPRGAMASLRRAIELAPADDQAWRALALAHLEAGDTDAGMSALAIALRLQRSEPTNLLLLARVADDSAARDAVAEAIQAWPHLVGAPGWDELTSVTPEEAVGLALERWRESPNSPEPDIEQALYLVGWAGRDDLVDEAVAVSSLPTELARAVVAVAACDPGADELLDTMPAAQRRTPLYWSLRLRQADAGTEDHARSRRLYEIMTGRTLASRIAAEQISPLDGNNLSAFSLDEWGYRRPPFPSVRWTFSLPWPNTGRALWMLADAGGTGSEIGGRCPPADS